MKEIIKLITVLTVICSLSGSLLALVNSKTKSVISEHKIRKEMAVVEVIIPEYDNIPANNTLEVKSDGAAYKFFVARLGGQFNGAAFKASSKKGFGGQLSVMIGVDKEGKVVGIQVTDNKESPEQSKAIKSSGFSDQFKGKSLQETKWRIRKDGGDCDGISSATISARAVMDAINTGVKVYLANLDKIKTTGSN